MNAYPCLQLLLAGFAASLGLLACSTAPGKGEGAAHGPTGRAPSAEAVSRLRSLPGVISVSDPAEDGTVAVSACAAEVIGDDLRALLPLQINVVSEDEAWDHACGCTRDGRYFAVGSSAAVACNTCRCHEGGQWACTLLACLDVLETSVFFEAGSDTLTAQAREVLSQVAELMAEQPGARLTIRAVLSEAAPTALPERRADAVHHFLAAAGLGGARVTVAPPRPPNGEANEARERVDLEIARD